MPKKAKLETVEIIVSSGVEGPSLYVDGLRVAGPKPWGGGKTLHRWIVDRTQLHEDMAGLLSRDAARKGGG